MILSEVFNILHVKQFWEPDNTQNQYLLPQLKHFDKNACNVIKHFKV